jgi:GNAT superfamily N-acetyltransferase
MADTKRASFRLRPADAGDVEEVAHVWYLGWQDGHLGHVPAPLVLHRDFDSFRARVPARIAATTVAVRDARVIGFVTVHSDELEQIFVVESARGGGVAQALLDHAEAAIARRYEVAWLAVVAGNARARRFYERHGWRDAGAIDYAAEIVGGRISVPSQRYEKTVRVRPSAP